MEGFVIPDNANSKTLNAFAQEEAREAVEGAVLGDLPTTTLIASDTNLLSQVHTPTFHDFYLQQEDTPEYVAFDKEIFVGQKDNDDSGDQQEFQSLLDTLTKPIQPKALQHSKEWYMAEITRLSKLILAQ
jgi:hypothetical protein